MEKLVVEFKTPDTVALHAEEAGKAEARKRAAELGRPVGADELREMEQYWQKFYEGFAARWVTHGESVTIVFDYDTGTATVVQKRK